MQNYFPFGFFAHFWVQFFFFHPAPIRFALHLFIFIFILRDNSGSNMQRAKNAWLLFGVLSNALEFTQRNLKMKWIERRQTTTGHTKKKPNTWTEHAYAELRWNAVLQSDFECVYDANGTRTILFALEFTINAFFLGKCISRAFD